MKVILNITYRIVLLLVCTLLLAGCVPKTPEDIVNRSIKRMKKVDSYVIEREYRHIDNTLQKKISLKEDIAFHSKKGNSLKSLQEIEVKGNQSSFSYQYFINNNDLYSSVELNLVEQSQLIKRFDINQFELLELLVKEDQIVGYEIEGDNHIIYFNYGKKGEVRVVIEDRTYMIREIETKDESTLVEGNQSFKDRYKLSQFNEVVPLIQKEELEYFYKINNKN